MGVVALGSVRSCAVTTLSAALAATWPDRRRVLLVEADPAGGTLAARAGWPEEPGLVSLAAAARRGGDPQMIWEHCQQMAGGRAVLAGPAPAEEAASALGMLGPLLSRLGELDSDVVVDCGRLDPGSAALALWEGAERSVLVARPRIADLQAVATWLERRPVPPSRLGLVVVGDGPYPDEEIADALGAEILSHVAWDPRAAEVLLSAAASSRKLRVAPLVRAARTLADRLAAERSGTATAAVAGAPEPMAPAEATPSVLWRARAWRSRRAATLLASANGSIPEGVDQ